jgi:hypothetical protein
MEVQCVKEIIAETINKFTGQELGNKITQFNMTGLVQFLLAAIEEKDCATKHDAGVSKKDTEG